MTVTICDTESDTISRTRRSTERLLAGLIEHHDYRMMRPEGYMRPVKTIPIYVAPEESEQVEVCILPVQAPKITVEAIKRVVCRHYGIKNSDIISERRHHKVVRPRQVAFYLARAFTSNSLPVIARQFGGRDHTTALHGISKIADLIMTDPATAADVKAISAQLGA